MKRLLLLVDFQEGFLNEYTRHLRGPIQALVNDCLFDEIIATRFINMPGGPWRTILGWEGLRSEHEQRVAVSLPANTRICDKSSYGLPRPLLDELSAAWLPGTIFLAGLETDICVAICAAQLFDAHIAPYVLSDYTGTTKGPDHQKHALLTIGRIVGKDRVIHIPDIEKLHA